MKPLKHFDLNDMRTQWNHYRIHYQVTDQGRVTHFPTGEMTVNQSCNWGRQYNRLYNERNIIISSTSDEDFGALLHKHGIFLADPDTNEKITLAWLRQDASGNGKAQKILIDLDHSMAVGLSTPTNAINLWPRHAFRSGDVYYPTRNSLPQGGTIRVSRPHKPTPEEKEHIKSLTSACKTWWEMSGREIAGVRESVDRIYNENEWHKLGGQTISRREWWGVTAGGKLTYPEIDNKEFADLPNTDRYRIAKNGIGFKRDVINHPYLKVRYDR